MQLPITEAGVWVRLEDFRGVPFTSPWCWWWDGVSVEADRAILDNPEGRIDGKYGCGTAYQSHVRLMLPEEVPPPPEVEVPA